jgi:hypothetical protein
MCSKRPRQVYVPVHCCGMHCAHSAMEAGVAAFSTHVAQAHRMCMWHRPLAIASRVTAFAAFAAGWREFVHAPLFVVGEEGPAAAASAPLLAPLALPAPQHLDAGDARCLPPTAGRLESHPTRHSTG